MRASLWAGLAVTILTFGFEWLVIQGLVKVFNDLGPWYFGVWFCAVIFAGHAGLATSYYVEETVSGRKATVRGFLQTIGQI